MAMSKSLAYLLSVVRIKAMACLTRTVSPYSTPILKKIVQALQYEFATVVVAILVLLISFQYLSTTNIPLKVISGYSNGTFADVSSKSSLWQMRSYVALNLLSSNW